jgi:hypothetical protein
MNPLENFSDEELNAEIKRREALNRQKMYETWPSHAVSENGVKVKDLIVIVHDIDGYDEQFFSLALKSQWKKRKIISDDWEDYSDWHSILPGNFGEAMENTYEFSGGTSEEGIALLKQCGFDLIHYCWETQMERPV